MAEFDFGKSVGAGTGLGSERAWVWAANLVFLQRILLEDVVDLESEEVIGTVGQFLAHKNSITKIRQPVLLFLRTTVGTKLSKLYQNFMAYQNIG